MNETGNVPQIKTPVLDGLKVRHILESNPQRTGSVTVEELAFIHKCVVFINRLLPSLQQPSLVLALVDVCEAFDGDNTKMRDAKNALFGALIELSKNLSKVERIYEDPVDAIVDNITRQIQIK